jgi:hypothetical protein
MYLISDGDGKYSIRVLYQVLTVWEIGIDRFLSRLKRIGYPSLLSL